MTYSFTPRGICAREIMVDVDEQGVIRDLQIVGGCDGNHKGLAALVKGMKAREAVERLKGISCGPRPTSCPDQLAQGLEKILAKG